MSAKLPLPGVRGQFVLLYRELVKLGLTPPQVDAMEMWQIGAMFDDDSIPSPVRSFAEGGMDPYLRQRVEAARAGEQQIAMVPIPPRNPQPKVDAEVTSPRV